MIDYIKEANSMRRLMDLLRNRLAIFDIVAVNTRYVDNRDLFCVNRFVRRDMESLAILQLDGQRVVDLCCGLCCHCGHFGR